MKELPNLYPLRFFLSLIVIIYHLPLISKTLHLPFYNTAPIFTQGTLAVLYFFALSGFLILRLIYNELKKTSTFNFKQFYLRRISRLYPVYYLVFFIGVMLYHVVLPKLGIPYKAHYSVVNLILSYVFFIPNVFSTLNANVGSVLIILWSIGIEEQFYLFIPVIIYAARKKLMVSLTAILLVLLLILIFSPGFYIYNNYYFYFLAGGLLSILGIQKRVGFFNNKYFHVLIYILVILSFATDFFSFPTNNLLYHLFNVTVSSIFISIISDYPIFAIKSKILNHLGKISYGIYMYHMIVITGLLFVVSKLKIYTHLNSVIFIVMLNVVAVAITALIASLSYRYFETIFYKKKTNSNLA